MVPTDIFVAMMEIISFIELTGNPEKTGLDVYRLHFDFVHP